MKRKKIRPIFYAVCFAAIALCLCGNTHAQKAPLPPSPPAPPAPPPPDPDAIMAGDGDLPNLAPFFFATSKGAAGQGYLGVYLIRLTRELRAHFGAPEDAGVMVSKVEENSPASNAGIAVGDIITAVDGKNVDAIWELQQIVASKRDKENAALKIVRGKKQKTIAVAVAERKKPKVDVGRFWERAWPGGDRRLFDVEVDSEALAEALENLENNLENGLLDQKLKEHQNRQKERLDREKALEKHLKELENRIKELEKKYQTGIEKKSPLKPV